MEYKKNRQLNFLNKGLQNNHLWLALSMMITVTLNTESSPSIQLRWMLKMHQLMLHLQQLDYFTNLKPIISHNYRRTKQMQSKFWAHQMEVMDISSNPLRHLPVIVDSNYSLVLRAPSKPWVVKIKIGMVKENMKTNLLINNKYRPSVA